MSDFKQRKFRELDWSDPGLTRPRSHHFNQTPVGPLGLRGPYAHFLRVLVANLAANHLEIVFRLNPKQDTFTDSDTNPKVSS